MLNLIKEQDNRDVIDKIYLYARDLNEPKYHFLIKKREDAGIKHYNNPNAFECSKSMDDVYENIITIQLEKGKVVFNDMIVNTMTSKRFQAIIKELFIRCRKLNISLVFITQSYFFCSKRLNTTHYFIMKINNKRKLQNIAIDHSADIDYKDFVKISRNAQKNHTIDRYYVTSTIN